MWAYLIINIKPSQAYLGAHTGLLPGTRPSWGTAVRPYQGFTAWYPSMVRYGGTPIWPGAIQVSRPRGLSLVACSVDKATWVIKVCQAWVWDWHGSGNKVSLVHSLVVAIVIIITVLLLLLLLLADRPSTLLLVLCSVVVAVCYCTLVPCYCYTYILC